MVFIKLNAVLKVLRVINTCHGMYRVLLLYCIIFIILYIKIRGHNDFLTGRH